MFQVSHIGCLRFPLPFDEIHRDSLLQFRTADLAIGNKPELRLPVPFPPNCLQTVTKCFFGKIDYNGYNLILLKP